jgi:uncharacterized protein YebE (UPF0316 family)
MLLFLIGIVEMLVVTAWTKFVSETRILASGAITMINVLIWYYVLQSILVNLHNWPIVFLYASGCAVGTMIGGYLLEARPASGPALSKPHNSLLAAE